jgi:hypothetical protein
MSTINDNECLEICQATAKVIIVVLRGVPHQYNRREFVRQIKKQLDSELELMERMP